MEITLICEVDEELSVRDLSEFLVDLAFLYDRCVMLKENPHQPILYSPDFYRRWRRLPRGLELKIRKISKDSPLEIVLIVASTPFILQSVWLSKKLPKRIIVELEEQNGLTKWIN